MYLRYFSDNVAILSLISEYLPLILQHNCLLLTLQLNVPLMTFFCLEQSLVLRKFILEDVNLEYLQFISFDNLDQFSVQSRPGKSFTAARSRQRPWVLGVAKWPFMSGCRGCRTFSSLVQSYLNQRILAIQTHFHVICLVTCKEQCDIF